MRSPREEPGPEADARFVIRHVLRMLARAPWTPADHIFGALTDRAAVKAGAPPRSRIPARRSGRTAELALRARVPATIVGAGSRFMAPRMPSAFGPVGQIGTVRHDRATGVGVGLAASYTNGIRNARETVR